mmetsp:Transcript_4741/g.13860  ORF Transcript_4741/g.13860 Transcript_4741/m.13860 type:complete len:169 (+) Transcript_4741:59-565(+)
MGACLSAQTLILQRELAAAQDLNTFCKTDLDEINRLKAANSAKYGETQQAHFKEMKDLRAKMATMIEESAETSKRTQQARMDEMRSMQDRHSKEVRRMQEEHTSNISKEFARHVEEVRKLEMDYRGQLRGLGQWGRGLMGQGGCCSVTGGAMDKDVVQSVGLNEKATA